MQVKKDIIFRFGIFYFLVVVIAFAIVAKIAVLQIIQGSEWKEKEVKHSGEIRPIDANRGNIYAADGSTLACSVPSYRIYMDTRAAGLTRELFNSNIDSLAYCLSKLFGDKSGATYRDEIKRARADGNRYYMVNSRRINFTQLKRVKTFPLFRLGTNKGGFIEKKYDQRRLPFGSLASRTVGSLYVEKDLGGRFGLELAFDTELKGVNGVSKKMRVSGTWLEEEEVEPIDGDDLITTIDVDLQDVAEDALMRQLQAHNAGHGCAVLMEVSTGAIKAIANLGRTSSGIYIEDYNYAVGEATEPGSTFKLASLIVGLEDNKFDLKDKVNTGDGTLKFYDRTMRDSHEGGYGTLTVKEIFEKSSNVGISKLITDAYKDDPKEFVDGICAMGLNSTLGLQIRGEGVPMIKYPDDPTWSGVSLPWMSIGYEVKQTPLQVLTFYNAVANGGEMVKPMFVSAISHHGSIKKRIRPEVINSSICSSSTIEKVHEMLVGVVEEGTATNIKNTRYKIAGKTGTAQVAKGAGGYKGEGGVSYQASFVGYFPADKPMYSCIVVVNAPTNNVYYANVLSGNVFREIADKVYALNYELPDIIKTIKVDYAKNYPSTKGGKKEDVLTVLDEIDVDMDDEDEDMKAEWVSSLAKPDKIKFKSNFYQKGIVPNVKGMGAKDAVFILENMGLRVVVQGYGTVKNQSLGVGQAYSKGATIYLRMG